MKILMIAPTPFFSDRGCHTRIYGEITALQRLGHEVVLCTYGLGRDMDGIHIERTLNFPWYKKLSAGPSVTKILLLPFLTATTLKWIGSFCPDVVHAHLHEGTFIAKFCSLFYRKCLYVFDFQGSLSGELVQHGFVKKGRFLYRFFRWLELKINSWFPIITSSGSLVEQLAEMGVNQERILNAMDGVDTGMFRPMPPETALASELGVDLSKPRILFMGLLEEYQGADIMLEAFQMLLEKRPDAQLILVGYPNIEKYQEACRQRGIAQRVFFAGKVAFEKTQYYMSLSDIAIAPKISPTEGDAKVYYYMSMGMAVAAFDRNVAHEILGDTGLYAKFRDASDMAEKLLFLIDNPGQAHALGERARQRVMETLSFDISANKIVEFYQKFI